MLFESIFGLKLRPIRENLHEINVFGISNKETLNYFLLKYI